MARLGSTGDPHFPFVHPLYFEFCCDTFSKWRVDQYHHAGDIVDHHALSFHEHDPNGHSAGDEFKLAKTGVKRWHRRFPGTVSIGNHDLRNYRTARRAGLPDVYLRPYAEVWETPNWKWRDDFIIDGVLYEHGIGSSGKTGALNRAMQKRCSLVIGHIHAWAGVDWHANPFNRIFALNVGCGIDCDAYAAAYGKPFATRPVLGCGIVIDGVEPHFIAMPCGRWERYHKSRAGKRRLRRRAA